MDGIVWALGHEPRSVIDLGCVPGKLTIQLVELGHKAIGVDPSITMLAGMREKNLPAVCGTAEAIPFGRESIEAVTAATAFHWFDKKRAVREMRRVLRSNGRVGLFWNLRDDSVDWVRVLSDIVSSEDAISAALGGLEESTEKLLSDLTVDGLFTAAEHKIFAHEQELTEDLLVSLIRSRSYITLLPEEKREQVLTRVRTLCREHPQLQGREMFTMPYRTRVFRAVAA